MRPDQNLCVALRCCPTIGSLKWAALSGQGDLAKLLFLFPPSQTQQVAPSSAQPRAHHRDSLRPGHALLAWDLSCQSKDQVPVRTGMLLQEAHSFMLETGVLIK